MAIWTLRHWPQPSGLDISSQELLGCASRLVQLFYCTKLWFVLHCNGLLSIPPWVYGVGSVLPGPSPPVGSHWFSSVFFFSPSLLPEFKIPCHAVDPSLSLLSELFVNKLLDCLGKRSLLYLLLLCTCVPHSTLVQG